MKTKSVKATAESLHSKRADARAWYCIENKSTYGGWKMYFTISISYERKFLFATIHLPSCQYSREIMMSIEFPGYISIHFIL
jgi:hypothetical protein